MSSTVPTRKREVKLRPSDTVATVRVSLPARERELKLLVAVEHVPQGLPADGPGRRPRFRHDAEGLLVGTSLPVER